MTVCAWCRAEIPIEHAVAFWPIGQPAHTRHVCRPSHPAAGMVGGLCFRAVVLDASIHAIAVGDDRSVQQRTTQ